MLIETLRQTLWFYLVISGGLKKIGLFQPVVVEVYLSMILHAKRSSTAIV